MRKQFLKGNRLYVWNWFFKCLYTTLVNKAEIEKCTFDGVADCHALALVVKDRLSPRRRKFQNKAGHKGQKRFLIIDNGMDALRKAQDSKETIMRINYRHPVAKGKEEREEYAKKKRKG